MLQQMTTLSKIYSQYFIVYVIVIIHFLQALVFVSFVSEYTKLDDMKLGADLGELEGKG